MSEFKEQSESSPEINIPVHDVLLDDEILESLSPESIEQRQELAQALIQQVPVEALDHTQILQPAIGCINRCNFCSQLAGAVTREMSADTLRTVIGGVRGALQHHERSSIGSERSHKPGVVFPYLDNDIGSYPHLEDLVTGVSSLGGKTRISTVGWSRHNSQLQANHASIASSRAHEIDGVRFSFTPYTYGYRTNREEYVADFANALRTYKPLMQEKGVSRRFACVEMRFKPDVTIAPVMTEELGDYKIISSGDYSLIHRNDTDSITHINEVDGMTPQLSDDGIDSIQIIGDTSSLDQDAIDSLFEMLNDDDAPQEIPGLGVMAKRGRSYVFANADGPYYCFEPVRKQDGSFYGVHYYPKTTNRTESGVLDATRPLLNELLRYKRERGIGPREDLAGTTFDDTGAVVQRIINQMNTMSQYSEHRAEYIKAEMLPLVEDVVSALNQAELGSDAFFAYGFLVDTGVIVNQGKAITEFKGLASKRDLPLTPNEEKGYGNVSQSSNRGISWRIAPLEMMSGIVESKPSGYGKKSLPIYEQSPENTGHQRTSLYLGVMALNPEAYTRFASDGTELRSYYIPIKGHELSVLTPKDAAEANLMPGNKSVY